MAPAVAWPYQKRQSVSSPAPTMKSERGCCMMQDRYLSLWLSLICMRGFIFVVFFFAILSSVPTVYAEPLWLTLPATSTLPAAKRSGTAPVNGVKIWYAEFGQGDPVVLLHGGLANANYWAIWCRCWPRATRSLSWTAVAMAQLARWQAFRL